MNITVYAVHNSLTYENVKTFVMSDSNNAVYVKSMDGKTRSIFNKDNVYGVINRDYLLHGVCNSHDLSFINLIDNSTKFSILFGDGSTIKINADYYDFNVYTKTVTFYAGCKDDDKSYVKTVGIFNMDNLIGFEKVINKEDKDGSAD